MLLICNLQSSFLERSKPRPVCMESKAGYPASAVVKSFLFLSLSVCISIRPAEEAAAGKFERE
jgi:hypothetical protein